MCSNIDNTFDEISQSCINLTAYGVQPRCPFEIEILDSDMQETVVEADHVMEFILEKIKSLDAV